MDDVFIPKNIQSGLEIPTLSRQLTINKWIAACQLMEKTQQNTIVVSYTMCNAHVLHRLGDGSLSTELIEFK